jgi:hypothetical protein
MEASPDLVNRVPGSVLGPEGTSMIPKSGNRFSVKIMLKQWEHLKPGRRLCHGGSAGPLFA